MCRALFARVALPWWCLKGGLEASSKRASLSIVRALGTRLASTMSHSPGLILSVLQCGALSARRTDQKAQLPPEGKPGAMQSCSKQQHRHRALFIFLLSHSLLPHAAPRYDSLLTIFFFLFLRPTAWHIVRILIHRTTFQFASEKRVFVEKDEL